MANNNLNKTENILVKVDQNNVILIDPNSVVEGGNVSMRNVEMENLVMYVNLEADLVPRTVLNINGGRTTTGNLQSIAKGTLNILRNNNGSDLDTSWTNSFDEKDQIKKDINGKNTTLFNNSSDTSAQTFGIETINIVIKGANFVPQVNINFVDVRGKTLFDSPKNSPYAAFFHLPWPIFYLTVKGYYGKAIRYRLHLTKFNSKYNGSNGNFEIATTFVGSTYAFLNDIPLAGILNAPYMYAIEIEKNTKKNGNTNETTKVVSKTSKGYTLLKSVYSDYVSKGLLPKSFLENPKTLREIISVSKTLDKILEREILDQKVDFHIFDGVKEFEKLVQNFLAAVDAWAQKYLSNNFATVDNTKLTYLAPTEKNLNVNIIGPKNSKSLESIINDYTDNLKKTSIFTEHKLNTSGVDFRGQTFNFIKNIQNINYYVDQVGGNLVVKYELLRNQILDIERSFVTQRNKLQKFVEDEMNKVIRDPSKGIGFSPTIRNIFGVIMANADVYIKLLKDVHTKAFDVSEKRKDLLKGYATDETIGAPIYPWPEIKKIDSNGKQKVLAYPADPDLQVALQSTDPNLWPEVDFVENYHGVSTKRIDTTAEKEGGVNLINYVFENNTPNVDMLNIANGFDVVNAVPYGDKTISSILYEIIERARYSTLLDTFLPKSIQELANNEYDNISKLFKEDSDIIDILRTITDRNKFDEYLLSFSPFERYPYLQDKLPTINYLKTLENYNFKLEQYGQTTKATKDSLYSGTNQNLINYISEDYRTSIYPFNSNLYLNYLNKKYFNSDDLNIKNFLKIDTKEGFISSNLDSKMWVKDGYDTNLFSQNLNILDNGSVNILNTPYFHKQLFSDFTKTNSSGKYVGSAYLLLNSLPFFDLEDKLSILNNPKGFSLVNPHKSRMSSLFREVNASHYIPYHLILKWGSLYNRYKTYINTGVDILSGFTTNNITTPINGFTFFNNSYTGTTFSSESNQTDYVLDYNVYQDKIRVFKNNSLLGPEQYYVTDNIVTLLIPSQTNDKIDVINDDYIYFGQNNDISYNNSSNLNVGIHPFYDTIFSQIVNGYGNYSVSLSNTNYTESIISGITNLTHKSVGDGITYYTNYIKNSNIVSSDNFYTLLPSVGDNSISNLTNKVVNSFGFNQKDQSGYRILWQDELVTTEFSGKTFASYSEYNRSYVSNLPKTNDNQYSISSNYRKVIDLIGTFSPSILEEFENCFLDFASEKVNDEIPYYKFEPYSGTSSTHIVTYQKFQDLLKDIVTVKIQSTDPTDRNSLINVLKTQQYNNLKTITNKILSHDNLIKITLGNSKEISPYVWYGFINSNNNSTTFKYNSYDETSQSSNVSFIKLYIGEDIDGNYLKFFSINNVELSEENVLLFRPLIQIFAGGLNDGKFTDKVGFQTYLKKITNDADIRLNTYLNQLIPKLQTLPQTNANLNQLTVFSGYQDVTLKLEEYNYFKIFNDKWVAGNSLGYRSLMEEFLFLDKANKDIGDVAYLSLDKLLSLEDPKNDKVDLYSVISMLIQGTGFDMRALPAYVNFYGTNFSTKSKTTPSKKVAQNLFGTFLDVDYQESSPKIIIQYTGPTSKQLELSDIDQQENKFKNDSGNLFQNAQSPLVYTLENNTNLGDLYKSNKVIAFEVSAGDENQSIFKGVTLDQSSQRETSESLQALENMGRSESGSGVGQMDVSLFDTYRLRAYTCEVTMLGNVMIQPTMYFYLKNIPMFRGSYWITDVSHGIRQGNITTTFKGTRIPYQSLPNPKDSFYSSFRVLFDKLSKAATAKVKDETTVLNGPTSKESIIQTEKGSFLIDTGTTITKGETIQLTSGENEFGVSWGGYNTEKYIVQVKNSNLKGNQTYFRAVACVMGGKSYKLDDTIVMSVLAQVKNKKPNSNNPDHSNILWYDIKDDRSHYFYAVKFDLVGVSADYIISAKTTFINPNKGKTVVVNPIDKDAQTMDSKNLRGPIHKGPGVVGFGIGLSPKLMGDLGLVDGEVVYFTMEKGY